MRRRNGGLHSLREIVFGLEDSLVSTLGTVTGVAIGSRDSDIILLSGAVLIVVEAISMGAGSYLSTKSAYQAERKKVAKYTPARAGLVMLFFYFLGGFVPLAPYVFLPIDIALPIAVIFAAVALFVLGAWKGRMVGVSPLRSAMEMTAVSLVAALAGYIIGSLVPHLTI